METLDLSKTSSGFFLNGKPWSPQIGSYEAFCKGEVEVVCLTVEADCHASLNFSHLSNQAESIQEKQGWIWWDLQLGLFQDLKHPLSAKEQFQALKFSIEYIDQQLFKEFESCSLGFCLFSGALHLPSAFQSQLQEDWQLWITARYPCDEEKKLSLKEASHCPWGRYEVNQFFHCLHIDYLHRLLACFSSSLEAYLVSDLSSIKDFSEKLLLSHPDSFEQFSLMFRNSLDLELDKHLSQFVFDPPQLFKKPQVVKDKAFCLPAIKSCLYPQKQLIEKAHAKLLSLAPNYRVISQNNLIYEWEDLDELWIIQSMVDSRTLRALKGFEAAGGRVHYFDF